MEKMEKEGMEVNLKRLFFVLLYRAWIIILVGVLCGTLAFGYAWFMIEPTYFAATQLYVNNNYVGSPGFSSSQLAAAQTLAETYMVILKSRNVLEEVAEKTELGYSYGKLRSMIKAASVNGTEVFEVVVTGTDYKHVAKIANAIAEVLPNKITSVVEGSSVRVVDYAVENPNPVGPSYWNYLILGGLAGALLAMVAVTVSDLLDTTINSEEQLQQVYEKYPLLAVIPDAEGSKPGYGKGYYRGNYEADRKPGSADKR